MEKKAIFLDVDGVLNSRTFFDRVHKENGIDIFREKILDKSCITNLKRIVDETGADIILSSSWRIIPTLVETLRKQLGDFGMTIIDSTKSLCCKERGDEIKEWLDRHPEYTAFVVLDDDSDMTAVMDHFVQTRYWGRGLTAELADKAIEILHKDHRNEVYKNEALIYLINVAFRVHNKQSRNIMM